MLLEGLKPTAANETYTLHIYIRIDTQPTAMIHKEFQQKQHFFWCNLKVSKHHMFISVFLSLYPSLSTHGRCGRYSYTWSHPVTYTHSVGLLWTSDRPIVETSTWQHTTLTTDIHAPGGIRTRNPSKRAAADPRLRARGHRERLRQYFQTQNHNRGCHI